MFNPMQAQAAIQNPVRFPDQKLQQYAAGNPPQPTGQVTPPMAGQELAMRNQGRQAFQRQQAMQDNPENSPTVFQQKDMQLQQAMQALQQKEQQLGLAGAMLAKKQQDLAARERGIAALPINPNMFTAMDGGIVFSGGGRVQRFDNGGMADRVAEGFTERGEVSPPSTTGSNATGIAENLALMRKKLADIDKAEQEALLPKEEADALRFKIKQEMQKEYEEYTQGRGARQQKMEAALRGKAPDLGDYLGAMAAGGPGKTLAETLSRMVPGAFKLRADQQAREMAAAKYMAEAEEKAAQADLAERRGQRDAAARLVKEAQDARSKAAEVKSSGALRGIQGLAQITNVEQAEQREATRQRELAEKTAREERKSFDENQRALAKESRDREFKLELLALENKYRQQNKEPDFRRELFKIANDPKDERNAMAKELLFERRSGAGVDARPTWKDRQAEVQNRLEEMTPSARAKLEKQNPGKTARQIVGEEVDAELEAKFGKDLFKGQGGKGATPSAKTPPPVGTIMEGYRFKGGDPSNKENWEKV